MKPNKKNAFCLVVVVLAIVFFALSACAGEPGGEERARVTTVDAPLQATPIPAWQPAPTVSQPEIRYVDRVVERVVERPIYIEVDRPVERVIVEEYPVFIPPVPPMPVYFPEPTPSLFEIGLDFNLGFGHRSPRYSQRYDRYHQLNNCNYRPRYQHSRYQQQYDRYDRHYDHRSSYRSPRHYHNDDCW